MNLLRFVPIKLTLLLVLGILLGDFLNWSIARSSLCTASLLSLLAYVFYRDERRPSIDLLRKGYPAFGILMGLLCIAVGILAVAINDQSNRPDHYSKKSPTEAQVWKLKIRESLKSNTYSDRYIVQVVGLNGTKASGSLLLSIPKHSNREEPVSREPYAYDAQKVISGQSVHSVPVTNRDTIYNHQIPIKREEVIADKFMVDDELFVQTSIEEISPPLNPHQFDYSAYMRRLGIHHQIRLQAEDYVPVPNPKKTILGLAASVRQTIIQRLQKGKFGEEELSVIQALLLGQRDDISVRVYDAYKNAGAVHILAVSGLHVGILLLVLQLVLRPLERLRKGKSLKLLVIVISLWGFALLAGFSASVVRAVTMFSFVAYALFLDRPGNTFNIIALSMFFILLIINPMLLFQVGFQMSYAAVFAIVWIYPMLQKLWYPKNRVVRYFWQLLSVSIAAQLGVLPISLFYFHQFPGLFFVSNLLIVPALGVILGMGILVIIVGLLNLLPEVLVTIYNAIIGWMNAIVVWVAKQEAFIFKSIPFDAVQLVLAITILICVGRFFSKPNFRKAMVLAISIVGFQSWLFQASYTSRQKEKLILAHQFKNSVLMLQNGTHLTTIAHDTVRSDRLKEGYVVAERITSEKNRGLANSYRWHDTQLMIIDSTGLYPIPRTQPDYLLLTGSPRLNLERLIAEIRPKTVLADGSNYKSSIAHWRKTCADSDTPFYDTGTMGAFYFD